MPRLTQAQKIEQDNEQQAFEFFNQMLAALPDPRRAQGCRYPLISVVVIALMATVCSCDNAEAFELWGDANKKWLSEFLPLPHGAPTQDVFLAVLGALDPTALSNVLRSWAALLSTRLAKPGKHVAIDGKTSRRSLDKASKQPALHTVSAYLSDAGLVLGAVKTDKKSNEITAIPELLQLLDLRGLKVTIDAIGCQTKTTKSIIDGKGDYLLAVKENQPTLYRDIVKTFDVAETIGGQTSIVNKHSQQIEKIEDIDKNHGRIERRIVELSRDLSSLTDASRWVDLSYLVKVTRERTVLSTGKTSIESAYYIGSETQSVASVSEVAQVIRRHWSIENELHWVLDMAFREDEARHRAKNTAQNMTTLRHFAFNIIKQDPNRKLGIDNSRKRAIIDRTYLISLFTNAAI